MTLKWISKNENGDFYVCHSIMVQRGIKGKSKSKVEEVIIVGVPKNDFKDFCNKHNLNYDEIMEVLK